MTGQFRFSLGPWNIHEGSDPFGPPVRPSVPWAEKVQFVRALGFEGMQFHDDDAVPHLMELPPAAIRQQARQVRAILSDAGVVAEFVAPRLWEDLQFVDGAYTANDPAVRRAAIERSLRAIDVAEELQTDLIVLWLAREGTYVRESKDAVGAVAWLVEAIDRMLEYHPRIRIAIEPKPNEPMDLAYLPTTGHAVALSYRTRDPSRVGVNIESAHAILAGLDPSDEMAFALAFGKLFSVHLNDQNGLKYDQDAVSGASTSGEHSTRCVCWTGTGMGAKASSSVWTSKRSGRNLPSWRRDTWPIVGNSSSCCWRSCEVWTRPRSTRPFARGIMKRSII